MYADGVYIQYVRYEWDEAKREQTLAERGIDFQAIEGFEWGTSAIERSDRHSETRWAATGYIEGRLHKVVYTERRNRRRIISLRRASSRERRTYEHRR